MDPDDLILQEEVKDAKAGTSLSSSQSSMEFSFLGERDKPMKKDGMRIKMKLQDAEHRRRFERFLNFCGIEQSVINGSSVGLHGGHNDSRNSSRESVSSSANLEASTEVPQNYLYPFYRNDEDRYYSRHFSVSSLEGQEYGEEKQDSDDDQQRNGAFVRDDYGTLQFTVGDGYTEFSNLGKKYPETLTRNLAELGLPVNSNDTFANFENHSSVFNVNLEPSFQASETLEHAVRIQPAVKYPDPLTLKFHRVNRMSFFFERKYKNNIAVCSQKHDLIFIAANSAVEVFEPISLSETQSWDPVLEFETRPSVTTELQRNNSTWPYYPHSINFMSIGYLLGKEVLNITVDDGRVLIYYTQSLVEEVISSIARTKALRQIYTINPDIELVMKSSAWGVDTLGNLIVVSDNTQRITLFYYDEKTRKVFSVVTHQLVHNIPSVSFIRDSSSDSAVYVSAGSISKELVVFKFSFVVSHDNDLGISVRFIRPQVVSRSVMSGDIWTTHYVNGKYFKKVNSLQLVTGDPWVDHDNVTVNRVLNESKILRTESDECYSSHLGLAAEFQNFFIPTLSFNDPYYSRSFKSLTTDTDRFRRIKKMYDDYYNLKQRGKCPDHKSKNAKHYWEPVVSSPAFNLQFLLVSGKVQVGLFRVNRLLHNATVSNLFEYKAPNEEMSHSDRLSLSLVIPELSCYIVASQVGLVSVFRLTEYRGIYGMRQEYVVPNYEKLSTGSALGIRTLIGLTYKKIGHCRYLLYLVYIDGLLLSYTLTDKDFDSTKSLGYL
ncbi:hypothetical protein FOA43_000764 [Brettanomyces nanus]|uniref:Uncharacterized protein n=1 Tax=Eeniella nana TaxID=13502 RepID=A0A875RY06_EENNA|nr:uncharacterized protein FOA43_000764 [Brettanomyces nanus]QPG73453.1 hypothetical protein FOA43_000764 [Brettanomyces nanus]